MKVARIYAWAILFVLLLSSWLKNEEIYAYVFFNDAYTEQHCVNKDKPELQCNGACQIAKILEQDDDSSKPSKPEFKAPEVYLVKSFHTIVPTIGICSVDHFFVWFCSWLSVSKLPLFAPPDAL